MLPKGMFIALVFTMAAHFAIGSFTGRIDEKNKFSLKNINKISKNYSLTSFRLSDFQFKGSQDMDEQKNENGIEMKTVLRFEKGNTTFIFPYKYEVKKVPKFKAPTPPSALR